MLFYSTRKRISIKCDKFPDKYLCGKGISKTVGKYVVREKRYFSILFTRMKEGDKK